MLFVLRRSLTSHQGCAPFYMISISTHGFVLVKDRRPTTNARTPKEGLDQDHPWLTLVFNLMMASLLRELHDSLMQLDDFVEGATALGTFVPPIAWVGRCRNLAHHNIGTPHGAIDSGHDSSGSLCIQKPRTRPQSRSRQIRDSGDVSWTRCKSLSYCFVWHWPDSLHHHCGRIPTFSQCGVASEYKHLGVRFAMDLDYDKEIRARLGAARQAFEQLKSPVFLNKAIPVQGRLTLFQSLVLSRLLYGCAAWAELSATTYRQLDATFVKIYRQNLQCWILERDQHDRQRLHAMP